MPTKEEIRDAAEAVARLFDLRDEYARARAEVDRIESEMKSLRMKVRSMLRDLENSLDLEKRKESSK